MQVGRIGKLLRTGLDGFAYELAAVSTVASAARLAHHRFVSEAVAEMQSARASPTIFKHYDCTPRRVLFWPSAEGSHATREIFVFRKRRVAALDFGGVLREAWRQP